MSHSERAESRKPTLEDILRLKRSERPSPEFWSRFEQELRAKQLAAIVEKRPWWIALRFPQAARYLSRIQVPLGAVAVLALSVVVVREYRPTAYTVDSPTPSPAARLIAHPSPAVSNRAVVAPTVLVPSVNVVAGNMPAATASKPRVEDHPLEPALADAQVLSANEPASVGPGGLMAMIPWASQPDSASQESEAVTLGELSQVDFIPVVNPGHDTDFQSSVEVEPVVMPVRSTVAEVAAKGSPVGSPREVRRNHILSNLVVDNTTEIENSRLAQVREVLAGALDDDRLYDSVRRLGMGGDRLTLKF